MTDAAVVVQCPATAAAETALTASKPKQAAPRGQPSAAFLRLVERSSPTKPTYTSVLTKASGKEKETRSDGARLVRRGELEGISAKYTGIADYDEWRELCELLDENQIKVRELEELRQRGKISTAPKMVKRFVYGERDSTQVGAWKVEPRAYRTMAPENVKMAKVDDNRLLLGIEAEEFMVHVIMRCHTRKKGLTEQEIKMWARAQARACPPVRPRPHSTYSACVPCADPTAEGACLSEESFPMVPSVCGPRATLVGSSARGKAHPPAVCRPRGCDRGDHYRVQG